MIFILPTSIKVTTSVVQIINCNVLNFRQNFVQKLETWQQPHHPHPSVSSNSGPVSLFCPAPSRCTVGGGGGGGSVAGGGVTNCPTSAAPGGGTSNGRGRTPSKASTLDHCEKVELLRR